MPLTREQKIEILERRRSGKLTREDKIALIEEMREKQAASPAEPAENEPTLGEMVQTVVRSGLEGASAGISEPLISGGVALAKGVPSHGMSANIALEQEASEAMSAPDAMSRISEEYNADVENRRRLKRENPKLDLTAQMVGAINPYSVGGVAAKGLAKGTGLTAEAIGKMGFFDRLAARATEGAANTAVYEGTRVAALEPSGFIKKDEVVDLGDAAGAGGALNAALTTAGAGLGRAGRVLSAGSRKAFSLVFGVDERAVAQAWADPGALLRAKTLPEVKHQVDEVVVRLRSAVDDKKLSLDEAKQALSDLESDIKLNFSEEKSAARDLLRDAQANLEKGISAKKDELSKVPGPTAMANEVESAAADLKAKVVEGSAKAREALATSRRKLDISNINIVIGAAKRELTVAGGKTIGKAAKAALDRLDKLKADMAELPEKLSLPDVKKILQQLDDDIQYVETQTGFTDRESLALQKVRRYLDKNLKGISKTYDKRMEPVRENSKLLSQVNKIAYDKKKILSTLSRLDGESAVVEREVLAKLGERTGRDFKTPLQKYMAAQRTMKDPAALKQGLGAELSQLEHARVEAQGYTPRARQEYINEELAASREVETFGRAKSEFDQAAAQYAPFKGITPATSEGKIRSLMLSIEDGPKAKNVEIRNVFKQLSQIPGSPDFVQMIDDMALSSKFSGEAIRGSREVNFWAIAAGGTVGTMFGDENMPLGAAIGSTIGLVAGKYGPSTAKQMLSFVGRMRGMPTVEKIQASGLPTELKNNLRRQLVEFMGVYNTDLKAPVVIPADQRAQTRIDIENSKSLTTIEKAKNLSELNKTGQILDAYKLVTGDEAEAYGPQELYGPPEPAKESGNRAAIEALLKSQAPASPKNSQGLPTMTKKEMLMRELKAQ